MGMCRPIFPRMSTSAGLVVIEVTPVIRPVSSVSVDE